MSALRRHPFVFLFLGVIFFDPFLWGKETLDLPRVRNFGAVDSGEVVVMNLKGFNRTSKSLKVEKVSTTCACTDAVLQDMEVQAGGNTELGITIRTAGKVGRFSKMVRLFYKGQRRSQVVILQGMIKATKAKPDDHPPIKAGVSLFSKGCAECHVSPGNGLQGEQLYLTDCSHCHGTNRQGGSGPPLIQTKPEWYTIIVEGKGIGMPGFSTQHGGHRDEQQLKSLMAYLERPQHRALPPQASGQVIYQNQCAPCHGQQMEGGIGPNLKEALVRHDKNSLFQVLKNGTGHLMMPSFLKEKGGSLSEDQIMAIADYLKQKKR